MKTYEVIQLVEMTVRHEIRAENADEANRMATQRTLSVCHSLAKSRASISFGDIQEDYVPARDE